MKPAREWGAAVCVWHDRWCTRGRITALRWMYVACWGGALLVALWQG